MQLPPEEERGWLLNLVVHQKFVEYCSQVGDFMASAVAWACILFMV